MQNQTARKTPAKLNRDKITIFIHRSRSQPIDTQTNKKSHKKAISWPHNESYTLGLNETNVDSHAPWH